MATNGQGARRRTWSRWEGRGRLPSEYEIVTHDLHYHMGREVPFEVGPDTPWNEWTSRYRDRGVLVCSNWNGFRDPDTLVYRTYVENQDEREVYVDGLLAEFDGLGHDGGLDGEWVASLAQWYTPSRYAVHALQMAAMYVVQMAPSSYISNCAGFQAADELRRVQRLAYRTKQLSLEYPSLGFGVNDRGIWEDAPAWQPLREVIERLLVTKDWGEAFVLLNLVVKPTFDDAFLSVAGSVARSQGDHLLALINDELYLDSLRSRRWSTALVNFLVGDTAANAAAINAWSDIDQTEQAVVAALEPLAAHGFSPTDAAKLLRDRHNALWQDTKLEAAADAPAAV